jgi:hypothetical protein
MPWHYGYQVKTKLREAPTVAKGFGEPDGAFVKWMSSWCHVHRIDLRRFQ